MANYSNYLIRVSRTKDIEKEMINSICKKIEEHTVELERPIFYVADDQKFIDFKFICRKGLRGDPFEIIEQDESYRVMYLHSHEGGSADTFCYELLKEREPLYKNYKYLTSPDSDALFMFTKVAINAETIFLSSNENIQLLKKAFQFTEQNHFIEFTVNGIYSVCSFESMGKSDANFHFIRVSKEEFLTPCKNLKMWQSLSYLFCEDDYIKALYFGTDTSSHKLDLSVEKISFYFNDRIVHEVERKGTHQQYLNNNYWDNLVFNEKYKNLWMR